MDILDPKTETEVRRSRCFDLAAAAYANNEMDLERYEKVTEQIARANDPSSLESIARTLPAAREEPLPTAQVVKADMSRVRKEGRWLESSNVSIQANMSKIVLDLTAYRSASNFRLHLDLSAKGSHIRLIVPRGFGVVERLSENKMSKYKDRHSADAEQGAVIITGGLSMSSVKVRRKKG